MSPARRRSRVEQRHDDHGRAEAEPGRAARSRQCLGLRSAAHAVQRLQDGAGERGQREASSNRGRRSSRSSSNTRRRADEPSGEQDVGYQQPGLPGPAPNAPAFWMSNGTIAVISSSSTRWVTGSANASAISRPPTTSASAGLGAIAAAVPPRIAHASASAGSGERRRAVASDRRAPGAVERATQHARLEQAEHGDVDGEVDEPRRDEREQRRPFRARAWRRPGSRATRPRPRRRTAPAPRRDAGRERPPTRPAATASTARAGRPCSRAAPTPPW